MPPQNASIFAALTSENRRVSATWVPAMATWVHDPPYAAHGRFVDLDNCRNLDAEGNGFEVSMNDLGQYIVAPVGGVAMPVAIDDYKAGLSAKLIAECPTLEAFRARWVTRRQFWTQEASVSRLVRDAPDSG